MSDTVNQCDARVLCVDDTDAQRYAVSRVLRSAGFEVLEATTGRQALDMMAAKPDAVVLDVKLPDISGLEVCREIKSNPVSARTAVVQVSATLVNTEARVAGLEGGADAYLIQPVAPDELVATIRALLRTRRAEERLWRSNEEYRLFFESIPLPCWIFDTSDLTILAVNEAAVQTYGYSRVEFMSVTMRDLAEDGTVPVQEMWTMQGTSGGRHTTKHGHVLEVEVTWAPLSLDRRDLRVAIVEDRTEKHKQEEAARKEEVRRQLLGRVLQVQEEERQRIARELHDEAGQLMTSLLVGLRSLSDARRLGDAKEQADRLRQIASQAIAELSRLARGLHSSVLEDLGLETALRRYVDQLSVNHKTNIAIEISGANLAALDFNTQLNVYRIIQEALTNLLRHSQARNASIRLEESGTELMVSIRDDGRGFTLAGYETAAGQHLGIEGMRERAAILHGSLEVESAPGKGTTVRLRLPTPRIAVSPLGEKLGNSKIA